MIFFRERCAAHVEDGVRYRPHIEVLERDHPERRFVAAMALHALDLQEGAIAGPYDERFAHAAARALLMPAEATQARLHESDAALAERFAAPLDQVAARREELALARLRGV